MAMICAKHDHDMCKKLPWYEQNMVTMLMWRHIKFDDVTLLWFMISQKAALEANLIQSSNEYGETTTLSLSGKATLAVGGSNSEKSINKQYFCERIKQ